MTEDDARDAVAAIAGPAALAPLERLAALIVAENERQNLIARSTIDAIWSRHILDSIQLLRWAGPGDGCWLDIGTGGGFPGLAIAVVRRAPTVLVEPRAKRAAFLRDTAAMLDLRHVTVVQSSVQSLPTPDTPSVISARAVAKPIALMNWGGPLVTMATRWLLQRGASWQAELAELQSGWRGSFHVEHSVTNPDGRIIIASGLQKR